jgi:hypothetical protein
MAWGRAEPLTEFRILVIVLTDVASGWRECLPLPSRDGLLVHSEVGGVL